MAVFLRDPSDQSGALRKFETEQDAEQAITEHGYEYATEEEVQARTLQREHGGALNQTSAFLNSAAAGAFDAAVALPKLATRGASAVAGALGADDARGELDAFSQQLSGRQFLENLNAVAGELAGKGNAEAIARQYTENARLDAQANPWASTTGYLGGQVLGAAAGGLSGASASLGKAAASATASSTLGSAVLRGAATLGVEGAAEGAVLTGQQASEDAWIKNEKLTAEQYMAATGWGAILGGGGGALLGGGGAAAGYGIRAGKRAASDAVSAAGDKLRSVFGPRVTAKAEDVAETASGALGVEVDKSTGSKIKDALNWAREKVEDAQVATTGVDGEALKKYGPMRWDAEGVSGRNAYINRDANLEGAKLAVTDGLQKLSDSVEPVIDEIRYAGLKREHVAQAIDPEKKLEQLAEARTQAQAIESMVVPMRKPGAAAKATREALKDEPIDREAYLATFDPAEAGAIDDELDHEIRDSLEALGKKTDEGTRAWKRVEQDVLQERVSKQTPQAPTLDPREGALRGELGNAGVLDEVERHVSRHLQAVAKTTDPVEAFMTLDSLKRGLQKYADRTGKSARALLATSPERAAGMRKVSDLIERFQEPLRTSLENEAVWGKAAANQRAINASLTRYIESNKVFQARYMREAVGYRGLDVTRTVREDATSAFLNRLGLAENQPAEQHLRAHLRATNDVLSALDGALDLGEKKALVQNALGETKRVTGVIGDLDKNVRAANQIDAILKADGGGIGSAGKTAVGALLGGPLGAAAGFAADVATHPGASMRTAIGLQRLANRHNVAIDGAIDAVFGGAKQAESKAAREAVEPAAAAALNPSPVSLEGKSLRDLGALDDPGSMKQDTLEALRTGKGGIKDFAADFAETGRVREHGAQQGIQIEMSNGKPVLRDGRHRLTVAREQGRETVYGQIYEGQRAPGKKPIFEGEIPIGPRKGKPANDTALPGAAASGEVFKDEVSSVRPRLSTAENGRVALPAAMASFLGDHEDKQLAFKQRAKEIHAATADMGERVRSVVQSDMADVNEQFPQFSGSLAAGMTRAALFLESKLPSSYRAAAPGAPGRSTRPVADHDIAKFARYWSAVNDPVSVVQDMALGLVSSEQIEAVKAVYPELYVSLSDKLMTRAADMDAAGERIPMQTRAQIGRFVGVQIEPAFKPSVLDLLDQARGARDQQQGGGGTPPDLAAGIGPESTQIAQRAGSVG